MFSIPGFQHNAANIHTYTYISKGFHAHGQYPNIAFFFLLKKQIFKV